MADSGRGSADSYIGSLISLTSKSEIRYEGVLYTVDTVNSNIALQDVRSFGTEGRKKDGPQIPPSDKVYDYIIFRATDIKDLQVKSSPPVHSSVRDPAIVSVQTQYSGSTTASSFTPLSGNVNDGNVYGSYPSIPAGVFQNNVPPLYPPSGLGSWGLSPVPPGAVPPGASENLALPIYWSHYYRPAPGLPHLQHPPLPLQSPAGIPGLHSLPTQQLESSFQLPQQKSVPMLGSMMAPVLQQSFPVVSSTDSVVTVSDSGNRGFSGLCSSLTTPVSATVTMGLLPDISLPALHGLGSIRTSGKLPEKNVNPIVPSIQFSQASGSFIGQSSVNLSTATGSLVGQHGVGSLPAIVSPALLAPTQFLQSGASPASIQASATITAPPTAEDRISDSPQITGPFISTSSIPSSQHVMTGPLLPLPTVQANQASESFENSYPTRRGRGRGRGSGVPHVTKHFTEDFDFTAMNEKFNKDEVWGELGKGDGKTKGANVEEPTDYEHELETGFEQSDVSRKPVYVKDDFFDTLSCNALGRGRSQRTNFSERRRMDTETFGGMFSRPHNGRGGRSGGYRGGYRGAYQGNQGFSAGNTYGGRFRAVPRSGH